MLKGCDHGPWKDCCHDTPENLKHQYTGTEVDVRCKHTEILEKILKVQKIPYKKVGNRVVFHTKKASDALPVLSGCQDTFLILRQKTGH